jgi:hypothetical protein
MMELPRRHSTPPGGGRLPSGTYNADATASATPIQLRWVCFRPAESLQGSLRSRGQHSSETKLVARIIVLNARHKRASGVPSRYAKARCHGGARIQ